MLGLSPLEIIKRYSNPENYQEELYYHKFSYIAFTIIDKKCQCWCGNHDYDLKYTDFNGSSNNLVLDSPIDLNKNLPISQSQKFTPDFYFFNTLEENGFCLFSTISYFLPLPEDKMEYCILDSRGYLYHQNYLEVMGYFKPTPDDPPLPPIEMDLIYNFIREKDKTDALSKENDRLRQKIKLLKYQIKLESRLEKITNSSLGSDDPIKSDNPTKSNMDPN